jgi:hypothetical protein
VQALIDLSDSTGLPIYLESSPASQGLYRKMGFMQVPGHIARVVHDAQVLGTEKDVEVPLMIKLPASITGAPSEKGKSVEDVYLEWYGHRDSGDEKVKAQ